MTDDIVYVNFAEGTKRVMNNAKLYTKLLTKFKNDTNLNNLEAALAEGNMDKAKGEAHTLKGVAANLSLTELFNQCLELETQIKANSVNPTQTEIVKTVFAATIQELDKILAENG